MVPVACLPHAWRGDKLMSQAQRNIKPMYQAEYIEGKFWRTVIDIVEDVKIITSNTGEKKIVTRKLVPRKEEFGAGYMLYFPQGHSMFIPEDDKEQLTRLGVLDADPALVDMETGEQVPADFSLTPKEIVARKTQNRPRPPGAASTLEG